MTSTTELLIEATDSTGPAGILDEGAKREIRRATLTAISVPGYQVPFGSREMPVARGWGSGGLQVTLAVIGAQDTVKVIDQGDDGGVNATNLRRMIDEKGLATKIEIDGGVTLQNAPAIIQAGAHVLVAGNTVFKSKDPKDTIAQLKKIS